MRRAYHAPRLSCYGDVRLMTRKAGHAIDDAFIGAATGDDAPQTLVTLGSHTFNRFLT